MKRTGLNMETVKKQNRSSILRLINREGPISKKDIAAELSLTPAAVTQLCGEFMETGLLIECGPKDEEVVRAGRKKILIDINTEYCFLYGVNIDPESTWVAVCNLKGEALGCTRLATVGAEVPEQFLERVGTACEALRKECGIKRERIAGAGVGIAGIVDRERGVSIHAYGIWEQPVEIGRILTERLAVPVRLENNVNAFAAAELLFGMGRMYDDLLLVKWGPGVGSSIILDRQVYEGPHGKAAELGHTIVEKDGERCTCGRCGCLETKVSVAALQRRIQGFPEHVASEDVPVLMEAVDLLARSIVNTATMLVPERVVLYGGLFGYDWARRLFLEACTAYDRMFGEERICYSALAEREAYIGPVAYFIMSELF